MLHGLRPPNSSWLPARTEEKERQWSCPIRSRPSHQSEGSDRWEYFRFEQGVSLFTVVGGIIIFPVRLKTAVPSAVAVGAATAPYRTAALPAAEAAASATISANYLRFFGGALAGGEALVVLGAGFLVGSMIHYSRVGQAIGTEEIGAFWGDALFDWRHPINRASHRGLMPPEINAEGCVRLQTLPNRDKEMDLNGLGTSLKSFMRHA